MKEKDFVDFTKMKYDKDYDTYYDEEDTDVGCKICYTHSQVYKKFEQKYQKILQPRCPKCGNLLDNYSCGYQNAVVSEVNYSNPDGEIGLYSVWECSNCRDKEEKDNYIYICFNAYTYKV